MDVKRLNFVKNGVVRLPPGFRFHPTDEELVVQYLKRKVSSLPLPASIIPEFDLQKADPWDLPGFLPLNSAWCPEVAILDGDPEKERYFFSKKEAKYRNGNRSNRATASGYWKGTGIDKQVVSTPTTSHQVVGMKKTLVFYRGKTPNESRTDWIMHEYYSSNTIDSWVLCRIFLKKRGRKRHGGDEDGARKPPKMMKPVFYYEFMAKDRTRDLNLAPSSSASSCSTGITQVSVEDDEESCGNSNCKRFACFTRKPN